MSQMDRRQFLKYSMGGVAALVVGSEMPWLFRDKAYAQALPTTVLNFTITDAIKDMATHNTINPAQCYFWIFREASLPPQCPGPHIFTTQGDTIQLNIQNLLDEPHAFSVPALGFTTGPIAPQQSVTASLTPAVSGTFLYYDNLNEPVNRVMGLHGALVVMPRQPTLGHKFTPYDNPPLAVQKLFDDFGSSAWFPGLAWEQGDAATQTPAFRQYIWLLHQASPNLFAEVGNFTPGLDYPADQFVQKFLHDPFSPTNANGIPQYFTISGQAGHFSHNTPYINPNNRVGEPVLVRMLNAGLWTHSMHLHANHYYVLSTANAALPAGAVGPGPGGAAGIPAAGGGGGGGCFINTSAAVNSNTLQAFPQGPQDNLIWLDLYIVEPLDVVDWMLPYMRPPDVPNRRGIGRAHPIEDAPLLTLNGGTTWPPNEELATLLPSEAQLPGLSAELSPLCYPMHDHSEPTQTSQGGNYNMGMIAGMNFIGDRNSAGGVITFPNRPIVFPPGTDSAGVTPGAFTPAVNPPWFNRVG